MDNKDFIKTAKNAVVNYFNDMVKKTDKNNCFRITEDEVFVVWLCKTLQNNKTLLSTTVNDGMYYEVTFNGDKKELYLDTYKKCENKVLYYTDKKERS